PTEPYAISKLEAEQALHELASSNSMQIVVVRPPLVYGACVRGNFLRLLRLVHSGVPLPFGSVRSLKSFVGVTNLAGLLSLWGTAPGAAGQVFLAADGEDLALADLLRRLAALMQRPDRTFPFPPALLRPMLALAGLEEEFAKLSASLRVDAGKARR